MEGDKKIMSDSFTKSESGATSRSKAPDFSLCPTEAIESIVRRFQFGIFKGHARNNWKIGKNDPGFIQERLNHAEKHLLRIQDRTGNRGDLDAVMCNMAMICWYLENGNGAKEILAHLYEEEK